MAIESKEIIHWTRGVFTACGNGHPKLDENGHYDVRLTFQQVNCFQCLHEEGKRRLAESERLAESATRLLRDAEERGIWSS